MAYKEFSEQKLAGREKQLPGSVPASALLALLMLSPLSASAHRDRVEAMRTLTIGFKTGETATFALSKSNVVAVTIHIGKANYRVPQSTCAKLRVIRFETVSLLWNGSFKSAAKADYFYLKFNMGTERTRAFGELPEVQLLFRTSKFAEATMIKKTAKDTWQYSKM